MKSGAVTSGTLKSGKLKSGARWFALGLVLLPVAVVAGAVAIARTSWFMERTMDPWIRNMDRNFAVSGEDCAVLVFGDSTALTGVSPEAIAAATGMTACNISQTVGSLGVNGTLALDAFLKKNPRPQFLLLVFAPENLHANRSWRHLKYAEGLLELVRQEGAGTVMVTLVRHPGQALGFSAWVYENTVREWLGRPYFSQQLFAGPMDLRHTSALNKPPETRCTEAGSLGRAGDGESLSENSWGENSPGEDSAAVDAAWVEQLRQKYAGRAGRVMVLVSPVPECDVRAGFYSGQVAGVADNGMERYPVGLFNDRDRHFTRDGARRFTSEIAERLHELTTSAPTGRQAGAGR